MKKLDLQSMLKREAFFDIFFPTVEAYYNVALGKQIHLSFAGNEKTANLVIKPRLSAAASPRLSQKARRFFTAEWNVRGSLLKRLAAKGYTFCMTRSGTLFSQYKLHMEPAAEATVNLVLAPNNRSIRIFDYASGTVGCIVKQGFTHKYFDNQLRFRLEHDYPFVLPVSRWGEGWFIEPILSGHPLARVTDRQLYNTTLKTAMTHIGILVRDTRHDRPCCEYAQELRKKLLAYAAEAAARKRLSNADALLGYIRSLSEPLLCSTLSVPLCLSHGDFQSGNIWVEDSGKVWLYDWETVGERSVWYDAATLLLSTRRAGGLERLWQQRNTTAVQAALLTNDEQRTYSPEEWELAVRLVLLEDMVFYLEDMLELPQDWGRDIFEVYQARVCCLPEKETVDV